ncbi:hypothetical protein [Cytobacillus firmus]|uniref:hypothetical protein n=1 Tax=Cytobacillus firmus TaxID=1399 RepID=UPI0024C139F0|nr:hypothetical protein [Cytobacillus firmus]WHY63275.1 hypothetical protein QNH42_07920 [Cytobacillus firmus]
MKKVQKIALTGLLTGTLLIGTASSTLADSIENIPTDAKNVNENKPFSYNYKGIKFTGDTALTEQELEEMYNSLNLEDSSGIGTYAEDGGNGSVRVVAPYYRTYTNAWAQETANLVVAYIATKLPLKITQSTFRTYVVNKLLGWATNLIQKQYVGSWVTRQYSDYAKMYIYRATLVHYTDSSYSKAKEVQYWEVNRSTSPNLVY